VAGISTCFFDKMIASVHRLEPLSSLADDKQLYWQSVLQNILDGKFLLEKDGLKP